MCWGTSANFPSKSSRLRSIRLVVYSLLLLQFDVLSFQRIQAHFKNLDHLHCQGPSSWGVEAGLRSTHLGGSWSPLFFLSFPLHTSFSAIVKPHGAIHEDVSASPASILTSISCVSWASPSWPQTERRKFQPEWRKLASLLPHTFAITDRDGLVPSMHMIPTDTSGPRAGEMGSINLRPSCTCFPHPLRLKQLFTFGHYWLRNLRQHYKLVHHEDYLRCGLDRNRVERSGPGRPSEDKWAEYYRILFPGHDLVPYPYHGGRPATSPVQSTTALPTPPMTPAAPTVNGTYSITQPGDTQPFHSEYSRGSPSFTAPNAGEKTSSASTTYIDPKLITFEVALARANATQFVDSNSWQLRGIYAWLVMVESKCIEVDNTQNVQKTPIEECLPLKVEQWQALIALYWTLLHELLRTWDAPYQPGTARSWGERDICGIGYGGIKMHRSR